MAPPEWGDQPRPLVKPGPHFARLDGVDAELVGQRLLAAFEDDDRNLAARQLLLTHDIGDERREPLPFIGPSRSRPYLDLVRSDFNRSDRVRRQIDVPRGVLGRAVARSDDDEPVSILAEAQDGDSLPL